MPKEILEIIQMTSDKKYTCVVDTGAPETNLFVIILSKWKIRI